MMQCDYGTTGMDFSYPSMNIQDRQLHSPLAELSKYADSRINRSYVDGKPFIDVVGLGKNDTVRFMR